MPAIDFIRQFEPAYGALVRVSPQIRRLVARNSGPFTAWGTGTYVIGNGEVAIIDPGPDDSAHVESLLQALAGETVKDLVITHTHMDHSPAAAEVQRRSGARVVGCGPHGARGETTEAGADYDFKPDLQLFDGDRIAGPGWTLTAVTTPGHTSNHVCYRLEEEAALFTGDHVMGWSTSVISPPDGDLFDYLNSLRKLLARDEARYWPTHGPAIDDPKTYVQSFIDHRLERERQIIAALGSGPSTIKSIVPGIYAQVDKRLWRAAANSVYSHLLAMHRDGRARCEGEPSLTATWSLA